MLLKRPKLSIFDHLYLPAIVTGLAITFKHLRKTLRKLIFKTELANPTLMDMTSHGMVTMQYPEEKWHYPEGYRGAPTLVRDEDGREKCVSCQLCEFICPPKAIKIDPGSIPFSAPNAKVEKAPKEFEIDMLRCIYCGLCEEVCPEEAIFLKKEHPIVVGQNRSEMIHNKKKLYEMGGVFVRPIKKWEKK
jgi:NADH-quinone oxidoreductase subunit I